MERRERQAGQLPTHILICFSRLLHLCCSNVVAQTPGIISPNRLERSWIVGHRGIVNGSESLAPGCTDLCLNALSPIYGQTLVGISVQMYPCQDSDNSLFQYNYSNNFITMWDSTFQVNRCLDAGGFPPSNEFPFTLQECNAGAAGQQWFFEVDGRVRSGFVNSSSVISSQTLYMQGKEREPQDWGRGWNTFGLYLSSGVDSDTMSSFSLLHYVSQIPVSQFDETQQWTPPNVTRDLILNGDFEKCGYDPGPSDRADFGSNTWWFIICSWTITDGSVQLVGPGLWEQALNDSSAALHLNGDTGPGTITQSSYSTEWGSSYSLSFDLAGDVTFSCGSTAKTLDVYIFPSSLPRSSFSFDVSGKSPRNMGWMSSPVLNFTAHGTAINVTFQSTTSGTCGPVIDNVVIRNAGEATPPFGKSKSSDSAAVRILEVTVSVGAFVLLVLTLVCCYICWMWRRGQSSTYFVSFKGIRCQSDMDSLNASSTSGSESLRGTYVTQYSWPELETATSNFTKVFSKAGSGVLLYLAEFPDGLLGTVKADVHRREWCSDEAFRLEVAILQRVHHSYLVNLIGASIGEGPRRALIFEYMPNGNLFDRLHGEHDKEPLAWQIRMVIAYQVACALEYLHEEASPPIVHRDVRSCNVLLQRDDSAKLSDFEALKTSGRSSTSSSFEALNDHHVPAVKKGSCGYMDAATYHIAPGRISKKTDVYSYGALLLELVTGLPPDELESKLSAADFLLPVNGEEMVNLVDPKLQSKFNRHELNEITGIVVKCLKPDARLRPSMSDVVFMLKAGFASSRPLVGS